MERITVDPGVCAGKPVIKGTWIMVRNILGMVAGGYNLKRINKAYPELDPEDIKAVIEYAAQVIDRRN